MSTIPVKPTFLVDANSDPVIVRIEGRASFQNSACLRDFINELSSQGKSRFVLDFQQCSSMDSTFLGVLAGAALGLRKLQPAGSMILSRLGARNLELIRSLGLHRLLTIDPGEGGQGMEKCNMALHCPERSELESARMVLEAHENLIVADEGNRGKFQDVLVFLKNRVGQA